MYTLINGSPKIVNSNSENFLNKVSEKIKNFNLFYLKKDNYENILDSIYKSDTIVLAFPLYADSPTSITLEFLDYLYDNNINLNKKNCYIIINCGFREGIHNITALNIIKRFLKKVNGIYKGSILIGAGEVVGKDKFKFCSKKALSNLDDFIKHINNKEKCKEIITTMDYLNNKWFIKIANHNWRKTARKNHIKI